MIEHCEFLFLEQVLDEVVEGGLINALIIEGCMRISRKFTLNYIMRYESLNWPWEAISRHMGTDQFAVEMVTKLLNKPLNLSSFVTEGFVEIAIRNPNLSWNWLQFSLLQTIPFSFIAAFPEKKWNYISLSKHPQLTAEFVMQHNGQAWNWESVRMNPNVSMTSIIQSPTVRWFINNNNYGIDPDATEFLRKRKTYFQEYIFTLSCIMTIYDCTHSKPKLKKTVPLLLLSNIYIVSAIINYI